MQKKQVAPGACCIAKRKSPSNSQACLLKAMPGIETKIQENHSREQDGNLHSGSLTL